MTHRIGLAHQHQERAIADSSRIVLGCDRCRLPRLQYAAGLPEGECRDNRELPQMCGGGSRPLEGTGLSEEDVIFRCVPILEKSGGADWDRTSDLLNAICVQNGE